MTKKYACIDPNDGRYKFSFNDLNIYAGGTTELILGEDNVFYNYSNEFHKSQPLRDKVFKT